VAEGVNPVEVKDAIIKSKEKDAFGHERFGGISKILERLIEERL